MQQHKVFKVPFTVTTRGSAVVEAVDADAARELVEEMSLEDLLSPEHKHTEKDMQVLTDEVFALFP